MLKKNSTRKWICLRGVRQNNLKNFDLDLPIGKLIVITGLSGSGKSSLAFDTLFAEGQRRYIETFSPYARQFLDRMDKPQVDSIKGIPPAIAIEQRNNVKSTRSTVGTMTEICDYAKMLWPHLAQLYCRQCGQAVRKDSPQSIWKAVKAHRTSFHTVSAISANTKEKDRDEIEIGPSEILITFKIPLTEKFPLKESLALILKQGYQRLLLENDVVRISDVIEILEKLSPRVINIVQDRLKLTESNRTRFIEACEQAYHFGKGKLAIHFFETGGSRLIQDPEFFSSRLHCAKCDIEYRDPVPALFSFNHPLGACPTCRGFGRIITIDYDLALPDRSKTLAEGAVKPWLSGHGLESQQDLLKFCRLRKVPTNVPFKSLSKNFQDWVINGDPGYGKDEAHEWPRAWYGVKGYFRWLESKAYKMHVRVLLSRYRSYKLCPDCEGKRFQPEALLYKINQLSISDFYQLSIRDGLQFIGSLFPFRSNLKSTDPLTMALGEVHSRLGYLEEVGLGYLTLDRSTRSLSGGEVERVNLTTCLGSRLVNTLFVLDEPSVGLHSRDTERLVKILTRLRDAGNTVVVVEHEAGVMRAADEIVDIGPGHGELGGQLVFHGTFSKILKSKKSLTGEYLSGMRRVEITQRRSITPKTPHLILSNAIAHNLKNLTVKIPLHRFVCLTGVSGSGKTTLIRDILLPALTPGTKSIAEDEKEESDSAIAPQSSVQVQGEKNIGRVVLVDQSTLGKTPRSNPAVYIGAFDFIRELFAQNEVAKQRGLNASAFSFNSSQGQCERCRGAGFEKIEMQFLSDVFIRCPDCQGRRYRPHILEIKLENSSATTQKRSSHHGGKAAIRLWNIADLLEATVDESIVFLSGFSGSRFAQRAVQHLEMLQEVGLGYLRLGQPINTLSGGESQRLKLVSHLAEFKTQKSQLKESPALFLFDEPTTGLHFDDVRVLLKVFQRLVDAGNSVVVIEHNLDVIKTADWLIDLGPEAGDRGGEIVATGTPEKVAENRSSHTGLALRKVFKESC